MLDRPLCAANRFESFKMEYCAETSSKNTTVAKFQSREPQNQNNKEHEFVANGNCEKTPYFPSTNTLTFIPEFTPTEPLNHVRSPGSSTSRVLSCRFPLGPLPYGSFATPPEVPSTSLYGVHQTASESTSANLDLRNVTLYKNAFMTATRSPRLTADNCVVVWCKDGLHTSDQIVQNHATFHRESRLPQHTPSTQHTADPFRNKLNPFEALTSKMRIPRHVFHPNEALRMQKFETYSGSTPSWSMNDNEARISVGQNSGSTFSSQSSTVTAVSSPVPYLPACSANFAPQFSQFFEAKPSPMMPWQCPPHPTPVNGGTINEASMYNFLPNATRPEPTPVGYSFNNMSQVPRAIGYQAPMSFVPKAIVPEYPDVQFMFRAANLLIMPNHLTQETTPLFQEEPRETLSSVEEETPRQDQIDATKETTSKCFSQRKDIKSHQCSFCYKIYSRHSALKIHLRTHTGEKPYPCKICNRSFSQVGGLESHTRSHTGEKPFECDICDRRFSHSNARRNHRRTHTGEKPFMCKHDGCGKSFADQSTLKKHHRIHTGEKPFQCPHCWRKFTQLGNMNKHVRCKHLVKK